MVEISVVEKISGLSTAARVVANVAELSSVARLVELSIVDKMAELSSIA